MTKTFNIQSEIAKANAEQLERLNVWDSQALTIPAFLLKQDDVDEDEPDQYDETLDWPDDHKLDNPQRGQAKWINGR